MHAREVFLLLLFCISVRREDGAKAQYRSGYKEFIERRFCDSYLWTRSCGEQIHSYALKYQGK